jgi:hypothetical protein
MCSRLLRRVVWQKFTNDSQLLCALIIALMMEAASTPKALINLHQTTRRNNPEDSHFHTNRHEKLKSQNFKFKFSLNIENKFTF